MLTTLHTLRFALNFTASQLREARLPAALSDQLHILATHLDDPCVLAVVGRMKAGKSTFINALLGEDLARVGVTETTATINYFRYGNPADPARPICCHWHSGRQEDVDRNFLDGLQGNDLDTLRRAQGIAHLEYLLPVAFLRDVTLVDTPGTAAVVDEHQDRTAEFLQLRKQLRQRQEQDTQRIGSDADAVIYLVGQVPRATDRDFLDEFNQATGGQSRALNALGIMAKIDLQPEILARRHELAAKVARQLQANLNTVLPVSAGLRRALDHLFADNRKQLVTLLSSLRQIPPGRLKKLLDSEEMYLELEGDDCPISTKERRQLLGVMPWSVFTTIARLAVDPSLSGAALVTRLEELSGFGPLKEILDRHFFQRGRFLRCFRILSDARKILNAVRFQHLPEFRQQDRADLERRQRFIHFIRSSRGDPAVARELEEFVSLQCGTARRAERLEVVLKDLDRQFAQLYHDLKEHDDDFQALEQLEKDKSLFTTEERDELKTLFGLYSLETDKRLPPGKVSLDYATQRQQHWIDLRHRSRESVRRRIAERAEARYGWLLHELMQQTQKEKP
ncbi:MAG: dynamin family protein [Gemmataceae bacterium]